MEKQQLLTLIQEHLKSGVIHTQDLIEITQANGSPVQKTTTHHLTIILYVIGALIAVLGVIIMIVQNWDDIGLVGRLFVTSGIACATYIAGLWFRTPTHRILSQIFFTIFATLSPLSVAVLLRELDVIWKTSTHMLTALALYALFTAAYVVTQRQILVLYSAGALSWFYLATLAALFDPTGIVAEVSFMVLGASLLAFGLYYQSAFIFNDSDVQKEKRAISIILFIVGTNLVLMPALFIGGWFNLLVPLFLFAGFYFSIYVKSRAVLVFSALALMGYIFNMTGLYFADSIGWSLSLILIGFALIGVGYGSVYLSRTYITPETQHTT